MKTLKLKERIKFAEIQFQKENSDSVDENDYKGNYVNHLINSGLDDEDIHIILDNKGIPRNIEHEIWNILMIEINPALKILSLNERFAVKNGLTEKEMNEWHNECYSSEWMVQEFRTYRYIDKGWFGTVSDEYIHNRLDMADIPRLMTQDEWSEAPKKFLDNT